MTRVINHLSHGPGSDAAKGHVHSDIGRNGPPKRAYEIAVHPGMKTQTKSGATALGGDHASAIDSLTGNAVVPGQVRSAPGWGNGSVRTGRPFITTPAGHDESAKPKVLKEVAPSWGNKGDPMRGSVDNDLGLRVLQEAILGAKVSKK
jgi:hypothetical protein